MNAFHYGDPAPTGDAPIAVHVEVADAPWQPANRLVRARRDHLAPRRERRPRPGEPRVPRRHLRLDAGQGEAPLLVDALRKLVDNLGEDDRVAIVSYASKAKVVLEPTSAADKDAILGRCRSSGPPATRTAAPASTSPTTSRAGASSGTARTA
ncbi:MAG: von Willebrand factor type A domain-containing protein [Deltaproteobacteria bacterium]|nr:von Willebrand factor type A domain-containing protein [Deltaproteobacteria bacterium]